MLWAPPPKPLFLTTFLTPAPLTLAALFTTTSSEQSTYSLTDLVASLSTAPLRSARSVVPRLLLSLHMKALKLARNEVHSVFQLSILRHT